jgi:hypothetical protein
MNDGTQRKDPKDLLVSVLEALKFTPGEIQEALKGFNDLCITALVAETINSLSTEEVGELKDFSSAQNPGNGWEGAKTMMEKHYSSDEFKMRASETVRKTLEKYIDYLKSRGDAFQKEQIGRILSDEGMSRK